MLLVLLSAKAALGAIDNTATANGTYAPTATSVSSAPSSASVPVAPPTGVLTVTKTPDQNTNVPAGTVVTYTYTIRNSSNVPLTSITLADTHNGAGPPLALVFQSFTVNTGSTNAGNTVTLLLPGDEAVFTAPYTVLQTDVNAKPAPQLLSNTVVANYTRAGVASTAQTTANVDLVNQTNAILLDKSAVLNDGGNGRADPGDTISYSFVIENTGNTTLRDVRVTETFSGAGTAPTILIPASITSDNGSAAAGTLGDSADPTTGDSDWDVLGPGDIVTFTATYTLVQADIDNLQVVNNATASGTTPTNGTVSAADQTQTPLNGINSFTFAKVGVLDEGDNGRPDVGDEITYTMTVTNTGTTTLQNVTVSDPMLIAGVPQQQFFATLDALESGSDPITTATSDLITSSNRPASFLPMAPKPRLSSSLIAERRLLSLNGDPDAPQVGDQVAIVFKLVNTGDGPLTNLRAEQTGALAFNTGVDYLAPAAHDTYSILFTHVLTAADIELGSIDAPARVTALARDETLIVEKREPLLLSAMTTSDEIVTASITPTVVASLAPGQQAVFTAVYKLKVANLDAGVVNNTATANARFPGGTTQNQTASATVPLTPDPRVAVTKAARLALGTDGVATPGDIITYTFTVTNTGNVTLNGLTVADPLSRPTGVVPGTISTLAPGASNSSLVLSYPITQDDINAGEVQNTGIVNGTGPAPASAPVTDSSHPTDPTLDAPTIVTLPNVPRIAIVKRVGVLQDVNSSTMTDVGDTALFTFEVSNPGNVALSGVTVSDPLPNLTTPTYVSGNAGTPDLDPGETWTFTATLPISQQLVDAGRIDNQAEARGTPPTGAPIRDLSDESSPTGNDRTITPIPQVKRVALIKTVSSIDDDNGSTVTDTGDTINYAFEIRNLGNVTLTNFSIRDSITGTVPGFLASLAPGQISTAAFAASYTVTPADMTAGRVTNTATVSSRAPDGPPVTDVSDNSSPTENDPTITPIIRQSAIGLLKYVTAITDLNNNIVIDAGDRITYGFSVQNTGNVPLSQVDVADLNPLVTVSGGPIGTLLAGDTDTTTFTATYVVTAEDVTRGYFDNRAEATAVDGTTPVRDYSDAESYTEDDPTRTYLAGTPRIALIKQFTSISDANNNNVQDVGDVINYSFTVTNTGNTVLTNVTVADLNPAAVVSGGPIPTLGISQSDSTTFTATRVLTATDFAANGVSNQARATGQPPTGVPVTDLSDDSSVLEDDPTLTPLTGVPSIALVKKRGKIVDANGNGVTDPGDVINYTFAVTNTGNVPLVGVTVTDNNAVMTGGPLAQLAPGVTDSTTFKATHLVTLADADAGTVVNQATAQGQTAGGIAVSDASDNASITGNNPTVVPITKTKVTLAKVASRSEISRGERVTYTITATNLRGGPYTVTDTLPPGFTYAPKSAKVNGVAFKPAVNGRVLSFIDLQPDAAGKAVIKLDAIAPVSLATGEYINRAAIFDQSSGVKLAVASATVRIREEHVFDCGDVIGRVFDDKNGNGYADDGEPGLPGVRVATVNGLLLTSDENGRFHVACADIPDASIGSTFLLKLDPRTLPEGYFLTTENPRDVRLTRGKVTKLNFGAQRSCDVNLDVQRDAYVGNSANLKPQWSQGIGKLVGVLKQCQGQLTVTYRCGSYAPIADARLTQTVKAIRATWDGAGAPYDLSIQASVQCGK
jgi:uncharacterized repeat protein (TIGR01451 family)